MPGLVQILVSAEAAKAIAELQAVSGEIRAVDAAAVKTGTSGGKMGRAMKAGTVVAAGGLGILALGLKKSVDAAEDSERVTAKLRVALHNAGISYEDNAGHIDSVIRKTSQLSGLDDEELTESFSNMVRTTGNVNEALKLNAIAADVARSKGQSLATAQSLIARVYNGSFMGLKRLGIAFEPVTAATDKLAASTGKLGEGQRKQLAGATAVVNQYDKQVAAGKKTSEADDKAYAAAQKKIGALHRIAAAQGGASKNEIEAAKQSDKIATRQAAIAALQKSFAGQAEAYGKTAAGAEERLGVAVENLQESIGSGLLPVVTALANGLAGAVDAASRHTTATKILAVGLGALATAFLVARAAAAIANSSLVGYAKGTRLAAAASRIMAVASRILSASLYGIPIVAIAAGIIAIGAALIYAYRHSQTFRNIVNGAFNAVKHVASVAADFIRSHWQIIVAFLLGPVGAAIILIATHFSTVRSIVGHVISTIANLLGNLKSAISGAASWASGHLHTITAAFGHISDAISTAVGWVQDLISWIGQIHIPDLNPLHHLPGIAGGSMSTAGGIAMVGELGPELVSMPSGARVLPAPQTRGRMSDWRFRGGGGGAVTIQVFAGPLDSLQSRRAFAGTIADEVGRKMLRSGREI